MSLQEEELVSSHAGQPEQASSLLDQIMAQTRIQPGSEGYDVARQGVTAFIASILQSTASAEPVNKLAVDSMIADIDERISRQMDVIIHAPAFQQVESFWRSLKTMVDRVDFRENIKVNVLHVTKQELLEDFEFAPEIIQSGFYKHVYSSGFGQFGGEPIAAVLGAYEFKNTAPDMKLLQYVSAVGAMAHAPFLSSVSPEFMGLNSWTELPNIKDLYAIFEGPAYTKWRALRDSEDSRYLGLTAPRFLLRQPYSPTDNPVKNFNYHEDVSRNHEDYLWGNTAWMLACNVADSFAKYRWCPNIIGPQSGGAVKDLPVHLFETMGQIQAKIPTEVLVTDRREFELAEEGFITLTMRKDSDNAAFFSANSVQKPKHFPGKDAETNYKLGTQLPYLFIINRLAHYIKVLQREQLGSWKERSDLERELNTWIRQYVADQENPPADVRSRKPLRAARVEVMDVEGEPGWYQVALSVRPHFKFMGANFELSLVGRLDRESHAMIPDRERTTGSLFERMEASPARNRQGSSIHALRQSIRQNLRNILNTRSGSCRGAPELGIDEPEGAENFRQSMSRAIAQCIERYEPRISHAEVQAVVSSAASPLDMTFHITAWVTFNETHEVLEFDMAPNGSQHYRVD